MITAADQQRSYTHRRPDPDTLPPETRGTTVEHRCEYPECGDEATGQGWTRIGGGERTAHFCAAHFVVALREWREGSQDCILGDGSKCSVPPGATWVCVASSDCPLRFGLREGNAQ